MINFSNFEKKTKIIFKDKSLLQQAFIHRSYINENPKTSLSHNERLEFLGDAVLELIVTDFLYKKYPTYTEGELTALRSALVNAVIISEVATKIGMNDYLLLSKGEAKDNGKARRIPLQAAAGRAHAAAHHQAFLRQLARAWRLDSDNVQCGPHTSKRDGALTCRQRIA